MSGHALPLPAAHHHRRRASCRLAAALLAGAAAAALSGCTWDSYIDPSKTGYFEPVPTEIPILERLATVEPEVELWQNVTPPQPEDLLPNELEYRLGPGDVITIDIFELQEPNMATVRTMRIGPAGTIRLPVINYDIVAAGKTAAELDAAITEILEREIMPNPQVDVFVEEGGTFRYTVTGHVQGGVFTLRDPDLQLLTALALAGNVPITTESIYVIRTVPLTEQVKPTFERDMPRGRQPRPDAPSPGEAPPVDIEDLIEGLEEDEADGGAAVSPGVLRQDAPPVIDIDELEPARVAQEAQVDVDEFVEEAGARPDTPSQTWIYDPERGEWVPAAADEAEDADRPSPDVPAGPPADEAMIAQRVIAIDYDRLKRGDPTMNIVVRPDDVIYVEEPVLGLVYVDGEVARPGVYELPTLGRLTLSRLISTAGGLGPLAIPEKVDLTRLVGTDREVTVRVDLAAIRNRAEPDFYLKPMDSIIVGTNFWAYPLAVIRNGFRSTYGFGFLLDRNFGNDVFGAPPVNRLGQ